MSTPSPFRRRKLSLLIATCVLSQTALAQTPAPAPPKAREVPKPAPVPAEITSIEVSAERPTNRIDRQVYDVKSDIGSTNNSAADALNNVPSVSVDPDGTVSLRGSTNVQILVDGKPSAMLQGDNRGAALNALPSDDIESIEVINNPGAQFGNEGGGGPILNLVMRRNKRPGGVGVANVNGGSGGRYNSSVSGSYNEGRASFQGGANFRHDGRDSTYQDVRDRINPLNGDAARSTQDSSSRGLNDSLGLNGMAGYNFGDQDRLQGSWSYNKRSNDQRGLDHYVSYNVDDSVASDYQRNSARKGDSINYGWGAHLDHKGDLDGEILKLDFRLSSSKNDSDSGYGNSYVVRPPGAIDQRSAQRTGNENRIADFTGDYERPAAGGLLKLGFKLAETDGAFDTRYVSIDPATALETVNLARTNRFEVNEKNLALYGTFQMRLNERWNVLGGLRTEYTDIDIHQLTSAIDARNTYVSYIPSAYATYKAGDKSTFRLAYARRIRRPNVNDLNPYVIYRDEFNVSSGNPSLKPTRIDQIELGYETVLAGFDANVRLYAKNETDLISERHYFVSDNVLLTTRENRGSNKSGGLEFSFSGKPLPGLRVDLSGNVGVNQRTVLDENDDEDTRSSGSLSVKGRFSYQLSESNQLQLMLMRQGKMLTFQGYRKPNSTANVSWRHVLTPRLSMLLNVTDVFDSNRNENVIDTDILRENSVRRYTGRIAYLGLSYRFGGLNPPSQGERNNRRQGEGGGGRRGGMPGGGGPGGGGF